MRAPIEQARDRFAARFGRAPRFVASAPGRVNLIGEHTDYNDGFVLPVAIDRWAVIAADLAAGPVSRLRAADLDEEVEVDLAGPLAPGGGRFADYVLGVVAGFAARGAAAPNLDLLVHSSVPPGAGLASSAAIEVAAARLLEQVTGARLEPVELARLCQAAEHAFPGTPCGIMDMLVAAAARRRCAALIDCRTLEVRHVPLPPDERVAILVADTGVRHALASSAYADRRRACSAAAARLGVAALRDASLSMLEAADLDGEQRRLARHVIEENQRTLLAAGALATGDLEALGELMFSSHASLRDRFRVSAPELDAVVDCAAAMRGAGVIGARMTGGGFGGCAVVLADAGAEQAVRGAIEGAGPFSVTRFRAVGGATY